MWSVADACLYWIDIEGRRLHRYTPATNDSLAVDVSSLGLLGCIALTSRAHQIVVASQTGLALFDWSTLRSYSLCAFPGDNSIFRFNDGTVTPTGSLVVGSLLLDEDNGADKGTFYEYTWDSTTQTMRCDALWHGCHISNGLAFDVASDRLFYIDTPRQAVEVFDYAKPADATASTVLSNRQIAFNVPTDHKHPDGMEIDSEGCLWIAHWAGSRLTRWTRDGQLLRVIDLPTPKTTAPCFGGPDLTDIYVTSASRGADLTADPLAGSLFVVRDVGVRGRAPFLLKGEFNVAEEKATQHEKVE